MRNWLQVKLIVSCVMIACVVTPSISSSAQQQRPADQQERIVISKDEVPIDVVVKDKKGRAINDLTVADFEVLEDGVKQEISSFRFVSTGSDSSPTATTPKDDSSSSTATVVTKKQESTPAESSVSAVALVFDRLSADSRARARDAALSYLGENAKKTELVGVFLTDLSVAVLQPFTNDTQLVKAGIEKAAVHASSLAASNSEQARAASTDVVNSLTRPGATTTAPAPGTEFNAARASMVLSHLEWLEQTQRDQQGNATTHGLLHIASALSKIPGRKAVIFFSEGLVLPPNVFEAFRSVINAANRNNVSFYSVDVAGLRTESKTAETRREINSRSDLRMAQLGSTTDPSGPMTKGLERNEDLLRLNPDSGLGQLANETGGFLITDSNDLKNRIQQVDEDLHSYYMLSYSSNNPKYDGHFRKIEVKLKRSGVSVQSRKGYYAIKGTFASPVLSYEAPALAALDSNPKSSSFPFLVGAFSFPDSKRVGLVPVMADVAVSDFTVRPDKTKKSYETDFSILMLVKNQTGEVITKLSNQYRLNGPIEKTEEAKQERVLFYREASLAPGHYTLETIAYDAPSGRSSVRTATVDVSGSDEDKLRLSDVLLLKRAEPANGADETRSNPLHIGNMIVNPYLGEPLPRSLKQVPFFFTVYTPAGMSAKPKLTIELISAGRSLTQMPGELPAADSLGRTQFVATLPLEKIPAGSYELKITITAETTTVSRSRAFTILE